MIAPDRLLALADVVVRIAEPKLLSRKKCVQGLAAEPRTHMRLPEANAVEHGKTG
jgi:hypothetical protein